MRATQYNPRARARARASPSSASVNGVGTWVSCPNSRTMLDLARVDERAV